MNCPKCNSEKVSFALIGVFCQDCNQIHLVDSMQDAFTASLIERYSDNPPEHNRPGKDGFANETGKIVKAETCDS